MGPTDVTRQASGRLGVEPDRMRDLGRRTVDMLVARLSDPAVPPLRRATPAEMRARLSSGPPQDPTAFEEILERLQRDVLPFASRGDHPGFLAFVPFSGTWPGALGHLAPGPEHVPHRPRHTGRLVEDARVDGQRRAGDVLRLVGGQEDAGVGDDRRRQARLGQ